jgi:hypothetical protein
MKCHGLGDLSVTKQNKRNDLVAQIDLTPIPYFMWSPIKSLKLGMKLKTGDQKLNGGLAIAHRLVSTYVLWNTKTDIDIHNIYELLLCIDALNQALGNK